MVRSLEEAEKEVLKAVSELDHDQTTAAPLNALELLPEEEAEEESEEAAEAHEEMAAAAAAAAAEEQNLVGEQFHLLRTLEQPTSAVAAAVMVAQVAEALKEADEQQQLESQEEEEDEDEAYVSTSSTGQQEQQQQQQLVHVRVQELVPGKSMLAQMWDIIVFAGPALGIWLSGPIMSLIDTSVIGQSSSLELAALGKILILLEQILFVSQANPFCLLRALLQLLENLCTHPFAAALSSLIAWELCTWGFELACLRIMHLGSWACSLRRMHLGLELCLSILHLCFKLACCTW